MVKKKFKIPLYFQNLTIIQTDDFVEVGKQYNLDRDADEYEAVVFDIGSTIVSIFSLKVTPSIIAHEAVHICNCIFLNTNAKLDLNNDEPYAYLMGWIVDKIHSVVKIA